MKLKNIIPIFIAHQLFEYQSKYIPLLIKGFDNQIKEGIKNKDYYSNELNIIYYHAINHKRTDIIEYFEENKIHINFLKKEFIYEAAKMNYPHILKNYLSKKNPHKKSKFLSLLLEIATLHSSIETVELLLNYGVDFKADHYSCVRTVLSANNFELFKIFHKYGLEINKNEYMFSAITKDNKEWFLYLLQNGFIIDNNNKDLIYGFMSFSGSLKIIEEEKSNLINEKELLFKASHYIPLSKKWLDNFYKKVDFYKQLEIKLSPKDGEKSQKVKKI